MYELDESSEVSGAEEADQEVPISENNIVKPKNGVDWPHFILLDFPTMRLKHQVDKELYARICLDLSTLRMFLPDLHFLPAWQFIRTY